jgi:hypothetical protein
VYIKTVAKLFTFWQSTDNLVVNILILLFYLSCQYIGIFNNLLNKFDRIFKVTFLPTI